MRKLVLLLSAAAISLTAAAQQRTNTSVAYGMQTQKYRAMQDKNISVDELRAWRKTTSGPTERWYNYVDYINAQTGGATSTFNIYLWNDTLSTDIYGDGAGGTILQNNTMVSVGTVLDPYLGSGSNTGFYDPTFYPPASNLLLPATTGYVVDSVEVFGYYGVNPLNTTVADTITIGYTHGAGALGAIGSDGVFQAYFTNTVVLSRYGLTPGSDSLFFEDVEYDSVKNTAGGPGTNSQYFTIQSGATHTNTTAGWDDTLNNGLFHKAIALNTPMNVPAGGMVGVTLSFKSGDPSFVVNDTVFTGHIPGTYRYNMFRALIGYNNVGTTPVFATYDRTDHNVGLFKSLPNFSNGWGDRYVPTWAWSASGGVASDYQYPYINIHISCPLCNLSVAEVQKTDDVHVYPNPANDEINISYNMLKGGDVTVSLTNMIGQVVATQHMGAASSGKAVFNTSALPDGMYLYVLQHNSERVTTGRVVIAH